MKKLQHMSGVVKIHCKGPNNLYTKHSGSTVGDLLPSCRFRNHAAPLSAEALACHWKQGATTLNGLDSSMDHGDVHLGNLMVKKEWHCECEFNHARLTLIDFGSAYEGGTHSP